MCLALSPGPHPVQRTHRHVCSSFRIVTWQRAVLYPDHPLYRAPLCQTEVCFLTSKDTNLPSSETPCACYTALLSETQMPGLRYRLPTWFYRTPRSFTELSSIFKTDSNTDRTTSILHHPGWLCRNLPGYTDSCRFCFRNMLSCAEPSEIL